MDSPLALASVTGLALVLVVAVAVLAVVLRRDRARARREIGDLRARLDHVGAELERVTETATERRHPDTYLITDAGLDRRQDAVPDRLVLSATLGEPLVKAVAFGHGVVRALSPESRNRIRFEMRREVRRARKQRRREMKDAWREMRAQRTGQERSAA